MPTLPRSTRATFHVVLLFVLAALSGLVRAEMAAPEQRAAKFEAAFMTDMRAHHHMAVMMGEMCLAKATHAELRAMCEQIIATQTSEIAMLTGWLSSWYGLTPEAPEMSPQAQREMQKLEMLSGAEFEIEFMKSMIRHHFGAIIESGQCLKRAYHAELVALCQNIITTQAAEIRQLKTWLCDWYGICHYGPARVDILQVAPQP